VTDILRGECLRHGFYHGEHNGGNTTDTAVGRLNHRATAAQRVSPLKYKGMPSAW